MVKYKICVGAAGGTYSPSASACTPPVTITSLPSGQYIRQLVPIAALLHDPTYVTVQADTSLTFNAYMVLVETENVVGQGSSDFNFDNFGIR